MNVSLTARGETRSQLIELATTVMVPEIPWTAPQRRPQRLIGVGIFLKNRSDIFVKDSRLKRIHQMSELVPSNDPHNLRPIVIQCDPPIEC